MSSILTNSSAMAALQTLRSINEQLDSTQNQISSGMKVASASDNAAYWSIATTMRSDNKALSAVSDSLGLGSSTVDVAYTAMNSTVSTLDDIKSRLVTAKQPGVDKSKIQSEIKQLEDQLKSTADAASFSGSNFLSTSVDMTDATQTTQQVVGSFTRDSSGNITISTININTTETILFNSGSTGKGLLQAGTAVSNVSDYGISNGSGTAANGTTGASLDLSGGIPAGSGTTMGLNDALNFNITIGDVSHNVTIDRATVDAALGTTDGKIADTTAWGTVLGKALSDAGFGSDVVTTTGGVLTSVDASSGVNITVSNSASSDNGNFIDMSSMDISNASSLDLDKYINGVDRMIGKVTTAASDLGATKTRITNQTDFLSSLMDSIDKGVGTLVDADMNQESTRLKALQTQQQLGIQALSIANSNSQNILSLFR